MQRRQFTKAAGLLAAPALGGLAIEANAAPATGGVPLEFQPATEGPEGFWTDESRTPADDISSYCNFYEFGTGKGDPAEYAHEMTVDPWSIEVVGEVAKPGKINLEDALRRYQLEERIYRLRCVEAWSMVVPWVGFSLADLLKDFEPTSKARYVAFETLHRPSEMRGTRSYTSIIDWPYKEGLRMDEA
ncbi:MAG: protein-methionine-sulfoxide reductase catalytic subunit MsrP, partial [Halioglobus sp.]